MEVDPERDGSPDELVDLPVLERQMNDDDESNYIEVEEYFDLDMPNLCDIRYCDPANIAREETGTDNSNSNTTINIDIEPEPTGPSSTLVENAEENPGVPKPTRVALWNIDQVLGDASTVQLTDQLYKSVAKKNNSVIKKSKVVVPLARHHPTSKNVFKKRLNKGSSISKSRTSVPYKGTVKRGIRERQHGLGPKSLNAEKAEECGHVNKSTRIEIKLEEGRSSSTGDAQQGEPQTSDDSLNAQIKTSRFGRTFKPKRLPSDFISELHAELQIAQYKKNVAKKIQLKNSATLKKKQSTSPLRKSLESTNKVSINEKVESSSESAKHSTSEHRISKSSDEITAKAVPKPKTKRTLLTEPKVPVKYPKVQSLGNSKEELNPQQESAQQTLPATRPEELSKSSDRELPPIFYARKSAPSEAGQNGKPFVKPGPTVPTVEKSQVNNYEMPSQIIEKEKVEPLILKKIHSKSPEKGIPQDCFMIQPRKSPTKLISLSQPFSDNPKNLHVKVVKLKSLPVSQAESDNQRSSFDLTDAKTVNKSKAKSALSKKPYSKELVTSPTVIEETSPVKSQPKAIKLTEQLLGNQVTRKSVCKNALRVPSPTKEQKTEGITTSSEVQPGPVESSRIDEDSAIDPSNFEPEKKLLMKDPEVIKPLPPVVCYEKTLVKGNIYLVSQEGGRLKLMLFDGEIFQPIFHEFMTSKVAQLSNSIQVK